MRKIYIRESATQSLCEAGYFIGSPVLTTTEINSLRHQLDELFAKKGNPRELKLWEIEDDGSEIWRRSLELFKDKQVATIMQELSNFAGIEVSPLPYFEIHRNHLSDRLTSPWSGWHYDCGRGRRVSLGDQGETFYPYCRSRLMRQDHVFGRLGFFLQENTDFGGSLDVIPKSHRKIRSCNKLKTFLTKALLWCAENISWRVAQIINRRFPKINCRFPETAIMSILGEKTIKPSPSSPVFFDTGLFHRPTPISESKAGQAKFSGNWQFEVPSDFTKYTIYCHYGSSVGIESYMYNRMRIEGHQDAPERWIKEIGKIETIYPSLAVSIRRVFDLAKEEIAKNNEKVKA